MGVMIVWEMTALAVSVAVFLGAMFSVECRFFGPANVHLNVMFSTTKGLFFWSDRTCGLCAVLGMVWVFTVIKGVKVRTLD